MRAMILAAGRGERMRELTNATPKPLLRIGNRYLIEYSLEALVRAGIQEVVINVSYLADQIVTAIGHGERYGLRIQYSYEETALETGGGIYQALPMLGQDPFLVLSCDVISRYDLKRLPTSPTGVAHLVLVDNPDFHPQGDFCLLGQRVYLGKESTLTFANIGVYRPEMFVHCKPGRFKLGELLKHYIAEQQVSGEYYQGVWHNIGTQEDIKKYTDTVTDL